jgi:transaldolase
MMDAGKDGMAECKRMQDIVNGMGSSTRIIVASIRDVKSMGDLMSHGMDTFTFNPDLARDLFNEELTITAARVFEEAAKRRGGFSEEM